ncbi:hypothetical protein CO172_02785 [Candidatus Uhrbacteria bacterium CG_4_9_14_3_um_filter_36_7]|uniref:Uncharacterized protein n=1 Tax=Candidatus Uhrbacteria bacterium CG_4_9_14_3_um_filter_36_7 TaxID=1975033 RepID=A0A2M7XH43_9BACT|nr:MAG: hypothetical protein CO172_02785 [Candidatus Uhrbacteria bacterium CG_4_9_14_3_um_filter_36_7]
MIFFRRISVWLAIGILILPSVSWADSQTNKCGSGTVTQQEAGRFLEGVCRECFDEGNCAIRDMEQVFYNISNFILAIVGSLVFLMYILGGIYLMASHGNSKLVEKGWGFFRISTIGLVIVLASYAGIKTLESVLRRGELPTISNAYIICDGTDRTDNKACDLNSRCVDGRCTSLCELQNINVSTGTVTKQTMCIEINGEQYNTIKLQENYQSVSCQQNLCPGIDTVQCCTFSFVTNPLQSGSTNSGQLPQ